MLDQYRGQTGQQNMKTIYAVTGITSGYNQSRKRLNLANCISIDSTRVILYVKPI